MKKDITTVNELMRILESENLTEINYECEGFKINVKRPFKVEKKKNAPKQESKPVNVEKIDYVELLSQGIGNFYSAQKNGESKLQVGAFVTEGEELGYIQAMGVKSSVVSNVSGTIHEILAADGSIVDFNRVILRLKK